MQISERARNASPSPTLAITSKVRMLMDQGVDVIGFGAGEPDFDTPDFIKDAAILALKNGYTKYTPSTGDAEIKQAIVDKLATENGLNYKPAQVIVSCGAKHSLYNIFQALLNDGDEVIIPAPYWVSYPEQVKLADGKPVFVETTPENDFMPTMEALEAAVSPRTKAMILNSPSNPTGGVATYETIRDIADFCVKHKILLVTDEIYEKLIYDGKKHVSPGSLNEEIFQYSIVVNGCSKAYAMTGWRIGYCATPNMDLIGAMSKIQDQSTSNPTSIAQKAAAVALRGQHVELDTMYTAFEKRRNLIVGLLRAIPGVTCNMPGGAFYAFPNISGLINKKFGDKTITSSDDLANFLLEQVGVAVVPGSGFGADNYIRLSYATSEKKIEDGLARIAQAVAKLE